MALTAQKVIDRAGVILGDTANERYSAATKLEWLNDGRQELAIYRPDIYAARTTLTLAAGSEQALAAGSLRFMRGICNVTAAGAMSDPVTPIEREELDAIYPGWRSMRQASAVKHFLFDEEQPTAFEVYPPVAAGTKLRVLYCPQPADVVAGDTLTAEGSYGIALIDYVAARGFLMDGDIPGAPARYQSHRSLFEQLVGIGAKMNRVKSPNTTTAGGTPPRSEGA